MVHVDAETLRRHPLLGVCIGGISAVFVGCLLASGMGEARALLLQEAPDPVTVHEAVQLRGARWVTVTEGDWHCERAIAIERRPGLERWVRGRVEATEVPILGSARGEILVASFAGSVPCADRARASLTGVVGSRQIFTSRGTFRRWSEDGSHVAVLNVGESPRSALGLLIALAAIVLLGVGMSAYYLALLFRSTGRHSAPLPARAPIEPS